MSIRNVVRLTGVAVSVILGVVTPQAASTDVVHLTVQGRLTDLVGDPIPDGNYTAGFEVHAQDGTTHFVQRQIDVVGGLYSTTLHDIPISVFECDDAGTPCVQEITISVPFFAWLSDGIEINQSGRAAVTARVDGDFKSFPFGILLPSSLSQVYPSWTTTLTSKGLTLNDVSGIAAFDVSTDYSFPGPYFKTSLNSTFTGPAQFTNTFSVNPSGDGDIDLGIGLDGFLNVGQPWSFDFDNDNVPEFYQTINGTVGLNPNSDGPDEFMIYDEVNPKLKLNVRELRLDRNNDNNADVLYESAGAVRFDTDFNGSYDANFTSGGASVSNAFNVTGNPWNRMAVDAQGFSVNYDADNKYNIDARPDSIKLDVNDDGVPEFRIMSPSTSYFKGSLYIDHEGDGSNDVFFTTGETILNSTLVVNPNNDGTAELIVTSSGVTITGDLTVTGNKSFVQPHPTDSSKEIVYVALEGGEAGTYARGAARLNVGEATINLPEHFGLVTNPDGLTAQITPRGPVHSMLYVESVTPTQLVVKSSHPADAGVPFDYMVNGVRKGFEDHQPIRPKETLVSSR